MPFPCFFPPVNDVRCVYEQKKEAKKGDHLFPESISFLRVVPVPVQVLKETIRLSVSIKYFRQKK